MYAWRHSLSFYIVYRRDRKVFRTAQKVKKKTKCGECGKFVTRMLKAYVIEINIINT